MFDWAVAFEKLAVSCGFGKSRIWAVAKAKSSLVEQLQLLSAVTWALRVILTTVLRSSRIARLHADEMWQGEGGAARRRGRDRRRR